MFVDAGQIYVDGNGLPSRRSTIEKFRYSAGVGLAWNSPVGPLKFSYALPAQRRCRGDRIQRFQFQVGSVF